MINKALFSSDSDEWYTPSWLFDLLHKEFNFNLDPCSKENNLNCKNYFNENGLNQKWFGNVFVNPPYSNISKWVEKCFNETKNCNVIVLLIPARTDTRYFHDYCMNAASELRFIKGRLKFSASKNSAPFPSVVVIYRHNFNETKISSIIKGDKK